MLLNKLFAEAQADAVCIPLEVGTGAWLSLSEACER